ncbi:MAG: hypothetical protein LAQ69_46895 [Acidobacteriia bacterium]|nr:hypothetical protein [Terriglobia bacterium]
MNTRFLLTALGCLLAATVAVVYLRADTAVRCTQNGPNQTVCRIDEPVVKQPSTPYHMVTFHTGDRIVVNAGGCVQTGGHGATWKRYVNPSGSNSDHLYWGTISIPGATQGVMKVSDVLNQTLTVSPGIADADLYLRLGYRDDDYSDNGYDSHDDGTENQCKGVGNAFVTLTIDHPAGTTGTCGGNTGTKPMDLAWSDCDLNGFPLNPRWGYQVDHNSATPYPAKLCPQGFYACATWPITNEYGFWCGPHVNWFAVTYHQSPADWESKSTEFTDDDYNFRLFPPNEEGVTAHPDNTVNGMEIEFDSDETIDHFTDPLWGEFHRLVHDNNSAAQARVKSRPMVVTGLLGLDCGHPSCSSEIHPAYAMAFDWDSSNLSDDQWLVFARNWGDEGYCGSTQHDLPVNDLKLLIPWQPGATSVVVGPDTQFYPFTSSGNDVAVSSPQITIAPNQGVLIDFTLPDPSAQAGVHGEVHLQWTMSQSLRQSVISRRSTVITRVGNVAQPPAETLETEKPENRMDELIAKMNTAQLQIFKTRLQTLNPRLQATGVARVGLSGKRLAMRPVVEVSKLPPPPHLARPLAPRSVPDPLMTKRSEALRVSLCEAYKNAVPGYPALCSATPRAR